VDPDATEITVHIALPRQIWELPWHVYQDEETAAHDVILGRFLREAARQGTDSIRQRTGGDVLVKHIEVTITDGVRAEVEEDPEVHRP